MQWVAEHRLALAQKRETRRIVAIPKRNLKVLKECPAFDNRSRPAIPQGSAHVGARVIICGGFFGAGVSRFYARDSAWTPTTSTPTDVTV